MRKVAPYALLFILSLFIIIPIVASASAATVTDFNYHYKFALEMPDEVHIAHVLYYATVLVYNRLTPFASAFYVNVFAMITFMSPLLLILFELLKRTACNHINDRVILMLALCLFIMAPISIWIDNPFMAGYVNPTVWHSPTFHALRLFIVPVSLMARRIVDGSRYHDLNHRIYVVLLSACLISLATMAKPSYTIALIPGVCLFVIYRMSKRQSVDWPLLILGTFWPGMILLGLQYLVNYGNGGDGIQLGILVFARLWMPVWQIPIRLLLSLAFPLCVYLLYFAEARKYTYLNISWLIFFVGMLYMYFFNVSGWRFDHGVFSWTGHSVIFALMYASVQFLVERYAMERRRMLEDGNTSRQLFSIRFILVAATFGLHVIAGIAYFFRFQSLPV